jgi:hypothetical protein
MKIKIIYLFLAVTLLVSACTLSGKVVAPSTAAQAQAAANTPAASSAPTAVPTQSDPQTDPTAKSSQPFKGGKPPKAAVEACTAKAEQDACTFTSQKGSETGTCETIQNELACSPQRGPGGGKQSGQSAGNVPSQGTPAPESVSGNQNDKQPGNPTDTNGAAYNIEQATSDKAQEMTIALDALGFITGNLGADSFFPPGKVADFWGFQYLRDNDSSQMGHAGDFLTSAAMNMLNTLTANQRAQLVALAKTQVQSINDFGYKRFVLMTAFDRLLNGDLPAGTSGLGEAAVKAYSGQLYQLDGQISFARAQLMGSLIGSFTTKQKSYLDAMVGKGMLEWPKVDEPTDIKGLDREVKVAVMTYAADLFSWYAGSMDADVYFCPERHGTYFGSFYLKDIPAMSNSSYAIPTSLTGDMGENMLQLLTPEQAELVTGLVDLQRPSLTGIVDTRREIATELRKYKDGGAADSSTVQGLMDQYGQLDGEIVYNMAVNFSKLSQSLTSDQKADILALRKQMLGDQMLPSGAYLYSQAIPMPEVPSTDFLFK